MSEPIILNPSPKLQFLSSKAVSDHNNMAQSPVLRHSLNMALLEYQNQQLTTMTDANGAAACSFKIKGALEFIDLFMKLGMAPQKVEPSKIARLDHNV